MDGEPVIFKMVGKGCELMDHNAPMILEERSRIAEGVSELTNGSTKQQLMSNSSREAEVRAACDA
eukprot:5940967-Amphidinium_carterae.2